MRKLNNLTLFSGTDEPFSNWYRSPFHYNGKHFCSVGQFMMYSKAKLFGDEVLAAAILSSGQAECHRTLGHDVKGFETTHWQASREFVVYTGCHEKFSQNEELRSLLLATAPTDLVEANPGDLIWGVGLAESDPLIADRSNWRGLNLLGRILEKVRVKIATSMPG